MRELHQHLLSVLMIGLMAFGASGWRAVHMLEHDHHAAGACGHACSPAKAACGQPTGPAGQPAGSAADPCDPASDRSPAPEKGRCLTCEHLDALTGAPPSAAQVPTFVELVCVTDDVTPASPAQPAPPRVAGARPPPVL